MPLTDEQTRQYNRMSRLNIYLNEKEKDAFAFGPMKKAVLLFRTHFGELEGVMDGKDKVTKGITTGKKGLKEQVAVEGEYICSMGLTFAKEKGMDELAAKLRFSKDSILKMKDGAILGFANTIVEVMSPVVDVDFVEYEVTDATLADFLKLAKDFTKLIGKAQEEASDNTTGNTEIDAAIGLLIGDIDQMDTLMPWFEKNNPKFAEGYELNSGLDNTGVRHNGIEGMTVEGEDVPVPNASIALKDTNYATKSDLNGLFKLQKVKAGDYVVVVSAEGYKTMEVVVHIGVRKMVEMKFVLIKS